MTLYAELATTTNFSFLRGATHPEDLVTRAVLLGHTGIGIADHNTLAGVVRAYSALEDLRRDGLPAPQKVREGSGPGEYAWIAKGNTDDWAAVSDMIKNRARHFRLAVGARLVFADGMPDIIAYPCSRDGWARLCRLLTEGKRRADKGECILRRDDLLCDCTGLLLIVMPPPALDCLEAHAGAVARAAQGHVWLGASVTLGDDDQQRLHDLMKVSVATGAPLIAVNDVLYDVPEQRPVQDILTCIREGLLIETAGKRLEANAERHLKPPSAMARLFRD